MVQTISPPSEKAAPFLMPDLTSLRLTPAQFEQVCRDNPDLRLELTSTGGLIVMPPTGLLTGKRNAALTAQLVIWAEEDGTGVVFNSHAGFTLSNGAIRSPDVSWVRREKWEALTEDEQEEFAPLCPDFVIELRSRWQTLKAQQAKMQEYLDNGAALGWFIDPRNRRVYIYRQGEEVEVLRDATTLSGDPILPGFELQLEQLW